MVEHLKPVVPEQTPPDVVMSEVKVQGHESSASSEAEAKSDQQRQGYNLWMDNKNYGLIMYIKRGILTGI